VVFTSNRQLEAGNWVQGAVAQLGERLVCNQEATGSIPVSSTRICDDGGFGLARLAADFRSGAARSFGLRDDLVLATEDASRVVLVCGRGCVSDNCSSGDARRVQE
jgi:hypothetical protein